MYRTFRRIVLTASALTAFAAPALADSTPCVVTAPEINLRKGPSMNAKVIGILKKDHRATAFGRCGGGWVKVTTSDGRRTGFVGGWALAPEPAKKPEASVSPAPAPVASAPAPAPARVETPAAPTDNAIPVTAVPREAPSNEQLAVQITQLRLKVLGLGMDVDQMKKEIKQIKGALKKGNGKSHKKS